MSTEWIVRRKTTRVVRNRYRDLEIVTLKDPTRYDEFLDLRTDEDGELRNSKSSPRIEIEGRSQWASYERFVD